MSLFDKGNQNSLFGGGVSFKTPGAGFDLKAQREWDAEHDALQAQMAEVEGESPEAHGKRVMNVAQQAFADRAKREQERMLDAVDSEYWVALCFQNRAQKEQFLHLAKLIHLGDKYLDGWEVCKILGIPLDRVERKFNISDKLDPTYAGLARELPDA